MTYQEFCKINDQVKAKMVKAPKTGFNRIDKYRIKQISSKNNAVVIERADGGVGKYHDMVTYRTEQLIDLVLQSRVYISNVSLLSSWKGFQVPNRQRTTKPTVFVVNILLEDEGDGTYSNICKGVFTTEKAANIALDRALQEYDDEQVYDYGIETILVDTFK